MTRPEPHSVDSSLPPLPDALGQLKELAYNLLWSWSPGAVEVFRGLDPALFEACGRNPVKLLCEIDRAKLEAASGDKGFLGRLGAAHAAMRAELARPGWFLQAGKELTASPRPFLAAYFCAEFGIADCFQIYSGGLGLLAGDHLKAASQLGLPLVALGLLYRNGYFHQQLDADGMQEEHFPALDAPRQPVRRVMESATGRQLHVGVHLPGRQVTCAVWRADVGNVRLYLLDTNINENSPEDREITANLYLGDQNRRIQQEIVLGIGGVRALAACHEHPTVFHMNEGHAAFMALERIRDLRQHAVGVGAAITFDQAREAASPAHLFTTHTPVPAGIDRFPPGLVAHYFAGYHESLGLDLEGFMALGREDVGNQSEAFSMAVLALRTSKWCNGVSRLHGEVSRGMWREIWPETPRADVPIGHVTNGIHTATWVSAAMAGVFDRHSGGAAVWRTAPEDPGSWEFVGKIPDVELWGARNASRRELVEFLKSRAGAASGPRTGGIEPKLDPNALTIGFARRFAGYKRATLLFRDPARLRRLLEGEGLAGPVQLVIAGKAHPGDGWGKQLIREIVHFARSLSGKAHGRIVFVEDYSIDVARELVRGCDVWLNTPIRGLEASGTSGMKAALNGVLNASILDGWWDEAYAGDVGYEIAARGTYPNDAPDEDRESFEANALYELIERQIVPDFYTRGGDGLPLRWLAKMKRCIATLAPMFSTHRMVAEYAEKYYFPAHQASAGFMQPGPGGELRAARDLADHIDRYRKYWSAVRVRSIDAAPTPGGDFLDVAATVRLGTLRPDEVQVQVYHGPVGPDREIEAGTAVAMTLRPRSGGLGAAVGGDGSFSYAARFPTPAHALEPSSAFGLLVRVLPGDPMLVNPFIPGLISSSQVCTMDPEPGAHL